MARIEKTVFISYRRTDVYTALAVYENLKNQGYDVFFDYRSISSGDFEQIITSNIRARAHFLLILTPTALDRCNKPGDWLRREIEIAIDEKRNIIPLFFKGFRFGAPIVTEKLTGKLKNLSRYNGLNVHEDYFDEAMHRVRTQYLNVPLDTVLHPVSTEVQKVVRDEQVAADKALEQIEDVKELVKQTQEKPKLQRVKPNFEGNASVPHKEEQNPIPESRFNFPLIGRIVGGLLTLGLVIWGISKLLGNSPSSAAEPTADVNLIQTYAAGTAQAQWTKEFVATANIQPELTADIGSTMLGKDGMALLYVQAGEFTMGHDLTGAEDEKPAHKVYLDSYWIDQTEVTNSMYAKCVEAKVCNIPSQTRSSSRDTYYENANFNNFPVIYVAWFDAKTYCEWAGRRLPTEAEWEKAARGIDQRIYPWGNDAPSDNLLNYNNSVGDTSEVGKYPNGASPYGALDMAGNVWEWVADWYESDYYQKSPSANPVGPTSGEKRVLRGGAWNRSSEFLAATRSSNNPSNTFNVFGFRCAMSATP